MRIMLKDVFNNWKVVYTNVSSNQDTEESYIKSIEALHKEMLKMGYYPPIIKCEWSDKLEKELMYYNDTIIGFVDFDY